MEKFTLSVPIAEIEDLRARLAQTRLPRVTAMSGWQAGVDLEYLAELVTYWREGYDWRATERRLNNLPQYTVELQGGLLHFVQLRSANPDAQAVILLHGWPYSYLELLPLAQELKDFHVVVPSLPGYGFSEPPRAAEWSDSVVGAMLLELMTQHLGYSRFLTYGEDVGTGPSEWLAAEHPETVSGLFTTHAPLPSTARLTDLSAEEQQFRSELAARWEGEKGYSEEQSTKPTTLAIGLNDSPAGLLAWIVEKFHGWRGTAVDLQDDWSRDEILDCVSLYWFSQSIGTSFLPYFDQHRSAEIPLITVPVGALIQYGERGFPKSYAARTCTDIRFWRALSNGGHFAAKQRPAEVAAGLREFVGTLG
ncbi:epoxide hydrolase family protein [Psychromicrobium lacuslunae]|uniref:Epoxide hydrolase N-terminal domain-containing protein n=1 Tax=Psychromicrobium lacuslunae TaxID=1618207 RepID=A0A0D4BWT6_9MICC|nr:epoxide hydrolase family protein [Psychromicrobium lacuslunae]AJT40575.1 hypothetical protein UM93_01730 [Psychromicrobium lacuslunae]